MICNKQKHIRSDTSYAASVTSYVTTGSERTAAASEDEDLKNSEDEDLNSLREEALASRRSFQETESGDDNSEHDSGKSSNKIF